MDMTSGSIRKCQIKKCQEKILDTFLRFLYDVEGAEIPEEEFLWKKS